jgi:ATP-dependent DNA ligase
VDTRNYTTVERKKILEKKLPIKDVAFRLVPFAPSTEELTSYNNQEGYVAKQCTARYEEGRQKTWMKIKPLDYTMVMCSGFVSGLNSPHSVGQLLIQWILQDPKTKQYALKDAGYVSNFEGLNEETRILVENYIRKMPKFKPFPIEVSYLRRTAEGKAYHATFHKIVSLEE